MSGNLRLAAKAFKNLNATISCNSMRCILVPKNFRSVLIGRSYSDGSDKPLAFSKSKAASFSGNPMFSRNMNDDTPWYQPFIISLSIGAILVWFCILREENDVDKELSKSLYDRVEGLEKKQLQLALQQNQYSGTDTVAIKRRLAELEAAKK